MKDRSGLGEFEKGFTKEERFLVAKRKGRPSLG